MTDTQAVRAIARVPDYKEPPPKWRGNPEEAWHSGCGEGRGGVSHPNRGSQSDGAARGDRGLGGRQANGFRQDAGGLWCAESPGVELPPARGKCERGFPFVGGAFGASPRPNYYPSLTAMAARELKRPVKVVYTRTQMYTGHGYRPYTIQKIALGAEALGKAHGDDSRSRAQHVLL